MLALVEELASMSSKSLLKGAARQNAKLQRQSCRRRYRRDIRRGSARSRIHIFGAGTLASKRQTAESRSKIIDQIKNISGEYRFESYISLTCHNCPDVVQALNMMSVLNPNISHTMIDGAAYKSEVESKTLWLCRPYT
ncbi:hypothetical protein PO124_02120 [Bacillus licheniformis]|nr:hypothetical protein [Bacillus licheniformis]